MNNPYLKILNRNKKSIRLDVFLSSEIEDLSRSKIKQLIIDGKILVDDEKIKPSTILYGGENIRCDLELKKENSILEPQKINFNIIFEDEYFLAINKPAGLIVHPGNGNASNTLANGLLYYLKDTSGLDKKRPGIIHRLDKDTSGIILVAKQNKSHQAFSELFQDRMIEKKYEAIIWGRLEGEGKIKNLITRNTRNKTSFSVSKVSGRESITDYKVIENFGPLTRIEMYPKTGRTHQLRVHMKHIGHPIFADDKYSGGVRKIKSFHSKYSSTLKRCFKIANRQMLHASSVKFIHPFSGEPMCLSVDLSSDMSNLIRLLKNEL